MKKYYNLLKKTKLFWGMDENELEDILQCLSASTRIYQKGECIFPIGECISSAALLLEGCVHIQKEDYWGNLSILSEIAEGELFGETYAVLKGEPMANNVTAVQNSTVLFLDMNRVLTTCPSACRYHTLVIQNFFTVLALKNRILTQKLEHMSKRTTREKLLSYLSEQSLKAQNPSFDIPFNRQQLADFLSVDRSAMSNELSKMQKDGVLTFEKNHFRLN